MTQQRQPDNADKFISGLLKIEKARSEIKRVVLWIASANREDIGVDALKIRDGSSYFGQASFSGWYLVYDNTSWSIRWDSYVVWGFVPHGSSHDYHEPPSSKVMEMRRDLHQLVDGMIQKFPDLGFRISPFFDAVDLEMFAHL